MNNKYKLKIAGLTVVICLSLLLIAVTIGALIPLIKADTYRELKYNPAMPITSRIMINGNELNKVNIFFFIILEMEVFLAPIYAYKLTKDEIKSSTLCFSPVIMWGVMAFYSYKLMPVNTEIPVFLLSAFIQSMVSVFFYLRYLNRHLWNVDDDDEDYEEWYFDC